MRIYRADSEVAVPVSRFGSDFLFAPLVRTGEGIEVSLIHLPPGGRIGRHAASSSQLFAILSGRGVVAGCDGRPRELGSGYAALFEGGEEHEASSEGGLTAVVVEGEFEVRALLLTREIVVAEPDPAWAAHFEEVAALVRPALGDLVLRIDHVGSTSVPGLAAKPIIDLDIVVGSPGDVPAAVERLTRIGYEWQGDLGVTGREAFRPPERSGGLPPHHLYVVVDGNRAHLDHTLLRDLLRADPVARAAYGELKKENARRAEGDIEHYLKGKAGFVAELLTRARSERGLPPVEYWEPKEL